jgi:hypothetical protein
MANLDTYYENLFKNIVEREGLTGATGAAAITPAATGNVGKIGKFLGSKGAKVGIGSLIAWMALDKLLAANRERAERGIQKEAIRGQTALASPENLYYQASLPTAQEEEEQARQALFQQILGGVAGPSLARGERLIGGS